MGDPSLFLLAFAPGKPLIGPSSTAWLEFKRGKSKYLSPAPRILQHLGGVGNWNAKEGKWELVGMQLGLPGDGKHVETGRDEEEQECAVNICDQSS